MAETEFTDIQRVRNDAEEDDEAANEHLTDNLSVFSSMDEIEKRYGIGIRLYYNFLNYIMLSNLVLAVLASVHWGIYMRNRTTKGFREQDLFVSAYSHDQYGVWLAMNIIAIVAWFSFGPLYYLYITKRLAKRAMQDYDNPFGFSGAGEDVIRENAHYTSTNRFIRRLLSYILFVFLFCLSGSAVYGLQVLGNKKGNPAELWNPLNFVITACVTFINFTFQRIATLMTRLEKHKTWSLFRKHEAFKMIVFKFINVACLYAGLSFAFASTSESGRCGLRDVGAKFFALILTDLVILNAIEILGPLLRNCIRKRVKMGKGGDDSNKDEFDVAQEYLELFYRQFVIYLGMAVFPMITVLGLITNVLEYPLDKYRMIRMCQKPKRLDLSMKRFLCIWMIITAIFALVAWPQGAVYILSASRNRSDIFHCCRLLPDNLPASFDETTCA